MYGKRGTVWLLDSKISCQFKVLQLLPACPHWNTAHLTCTYSPNLHVAHYKFAQEENGLFEAQDYFYIIFLLLNVPAVVHTCIDNQKANLYTTMFSQVSCFLMSCLESSLLILIIRGDNYVRLSYILYLIMLDTSAGMTLLVWRPPRELILQK